MNHLKKTRLTKERTRGYLMKQLILERVLKKFNNGGSREFSCDTYSEREAVLYIELQNPKMIATWIPLSESCGWNTKDTSTFSHFPKDTWTHSPFPEEFLRYFGTRYIVPTLRR